MTFGLAMLGEGSRAYASFLPIVISLPSSTAPVSEPGAGACDFVEHQAERPSLEMVLPLQGLAGESGRPAGSGSSSGSVVSPIGQVFTFGWGGRLLPPDFSARLRFLQAGFVLHSIVFAVFEPPRAAF
jgi:hypothetical protein